MLFPHADWLARKRLAKYYSPPSRRRKTKWLPVSNKVSLKQIKVLFGPLVVQLVWYILKQLFTSVSVKVVDIYLAAFSAPSSPRKAKWLPVSNKVSLKQVKVLFGPLVIQLVCYILKQLFTSVSVKAVGIYLAASQVSKDAATR